MTELSFDTSILDDDDEETIVTVTYWPGYDRPGKFTGPPESCYPDESEDCELISVIPEDGGDDLLESLSGDQQARLVEECWENLAFRKEAAEEAAAEAAADRLADDYY